MFFVNYLLFLILDWKKFGSIPCTADNANGFENSLRLLMDKSGLSVADSESLALKYYVLDCLVPAVVCPLHPHHPQNPVSFYFHSTSFRMQQYGSMRASRLRSRSPTSCAAPGSLWASFSCTSRAGGPSVWFATDLQLFPPIARMSSQSRVRWTNQYNRIRHSLLAHSKRWVSAPTFAAYCFNNVFTVFYCIYEYLKLYSFILNLHFYWYVLSVDRPWDSLPRGSESAARERVFTLFVRRQVRALVLLDLKIMCITVCLLSRSSSVHVARVNMQAARSGRAGVRARGASARCAGFVGVRRVGHAAADGAGPRASAALHRARSNALLARGRAPRHAFSLLCGVMYSTVLSHTPYIVVHVNFTCTMNWTILISYYTVPVISIVQAVLAPCWV